MDNQLFDYSPIVEREPVHWPDGARVAFYVGLNVEHYQVDRPSTSIFPDTRALAPDPLNYGWHRYVDEALEYVVNHPGVWVTTSDEIAEHYAARTE